jgi:hypothetical protein
MRTHTEDFWSRQESNLAALRAAGIREVGEDLPRLRTGGKSREEQHREYVRREQIREWALSWKHRGTEQ